jgi:hypothetical protein
MADVLLPTLTTRGQLVKSRIQFSPRFPSLVMSFEGTMVLNNELSSKNRILTVCRCERVGKGNVECNRDCVNC